VGYERYRHLPKPVTISVRAESPDLTPWAACISEVAFRAVRSFGRQTGGSAQAVLAGGVTSTRRLQENGCGPGSQLLFLPKNDWRPDKSSESDSTVPLPAHVLLDTYEVTFETLLSSLPSRNASSTPIPPSPR